MLSLRDITQDFKVRGHGIRRPKIRAVDGVSLAVEAGQVLCIVGESGCGKTTLGRVAAGLCNPTAGEVQVDGVSMYRGRAGGRKKAATAVQLIHQDPFAALNPALNVREELALPLAEHDIVRRAEIDRECRRLLRLTGLDPEQVLTKYPHQLSGGQRQRVVIARALTVRPKYLIGDEAVTMVDVSSRLVLLDLLRDVCDQQGLGLVFITHDFAVARYIAYTGQIAVMYRGRIVEQGATEEVIQTPRHPYTRVLLSTVLPLVAGEDYQIDRLQPKAYEVSQRRTEEQGCVFASRCPLAFDRCSQAAPTLDAMDDGRQVACYLVGSKTENVDEQATV